MTADLQAYHLVDARQCNICASANTYHTSLSACCLTTTENDFSARRFFLWNEVLQLTTTDKRFFGVTSRSAKSAKKIMYLKNKLQWGLSQWSKDSKTRFPFLVFIFRFHSSFPFFVFRLVRSKENWTSDQRIVRLAFHSSFSILRFPFFVFRLRLKNKNTSSIRRAVNWQASFRVLKGCWWHAQIEKRQLSLHFGRKRLH